MLQNPTTYGGLVALICWHHGTAPDLAKAFGVNKDDLKPWDPWQPTVFDLVFQITWNSSGQAGLAVGYQALLFGDTATAQTVGSRQK